MKKKKKKRRERDRKNKEIKDYITSDYYSSEFSVGFYRNLRKYGLGSIEKALTEGIPLIVPGPTSG